MHVNCRGGRKKNKAVLEPHVSPMGAIVKDVVNLGVEDCKVLEHNNQLTLNA